MSSPVSMTDSNDKASSFENLNSNSRSSEEAIESVNKAIIDYSNNEQTSFYECVECGMRFLNIELLNEHFIKHSGK